MSFTLWSALFEASSRVSDTHIHIHILARGQCIGIDEYYFLPNLFKNTTKDLKNFNSLLSLFGEFVLIILVTSVSPYILNVFSCISHQYLVMCNVSYKLLTALRHLDCAIKEVFFYRVDFSRWSIWNTRNYPPLRPALKATRIVERINEILWVGSREKVNHDIYIYIKLEEREEKIENDSVNINITIQKIAISLLWNFIITIIHINKYI